MGKLSKELRMGIHNRFDIEVVDVETGEIKQKAQAFNVVCNNYFSKILSDGEAESIQFGSGTGTPAVTDTALFTYVGYGDASATYSPYDRIDSSHEYEGVWSRQIKRTIPNTSYVGATITEVGLATSTSGSNLVTHAMLQDMNGNPISIQHTSTDIVNIYCTVYLHYDGQESDIHLYAGWEYYYYGKENKRAVVNRALLKPLTYTNGGDRYAYMITGVKQAMVLAGDNHVFSITTSTRNGALVITANQVPITKANYNGIGVICIANYYYTNYGGGSGQKVSVAIDAGGSTIPPTQISGEVVGTGDGITTKFRTKYSYPYNAVVKINGIAVQGVSVNKALAGLSWNDGADVGYGEGVLNMGYHYRTLFKEDLSIPAYFNQGQGVVFYNGSVIESAHPEVGFRGFYWNGSGTINLKGSNDGVNWDDVPVWSNSSSIDAAYQFYKYYKNETGKTIEGIYLNAYDGYNIIFDNPPAQGDVITIDYTTDYIPKDSDHVLDVELTFTFGEWTGE